VRRYVPAVACSLLAPHTTPVKETTMPIEVTDEMVQAYIAAWQDRLFKPPHMGEERPAVRAGLAAVLALVERDQSVQLEAAQAVVHAYRKSHAKGYFQYPRGPLAKAVVRLHETMPAPADRP
jgi:hypothetical protein